MSYNNNDYQPQSGKILDSNNNVKNTADGIDADGTQITEGKISGPRLIATISYSSFSENTTYFGGLSQKLTRHAKARTFLIANTLNQPLTTQGLLPYDSIDNNTSSIPTSVSMTALTAGQRGYYTSEQSSYALLAAHVDSLFLSLGMGATAPTSGNILIYVVEVF